jgi:uncharacterized repeat protein (TIGR01451 family)
MVFLRSYKMKLNNLLRLILLGALVSPLASFAAGTPAGTVINNTATATYSPNGGPTVTTNSNSASITVVELINVTTVSNDAGNVPTVTPDTNKVLTFTVTNTGNGTETFALTANRAVAGDQFDPTVGSAGSIFIENGLQAGFQATGANADVLYIPGSNDLVLNANSSTANSNIVYLVSDIPTALVNNDLGKATLTASSKTTGAAGSAPGTTLPGLGDGGIDAVVGATQATANATGTYIVTAFSVVTSKSATVLDPFGGSKVVPGSVITYTITTVVTGSGGVANALIVNDTIPANTTYLAGSMKLNATVLTDATDADAGKFNGTAVVVNIGDVTATAGGTTNTVVFKATVN